MKHALLATTALVALTGAASAEITITGDARIGFTTIEGAAATDAVTQTYGTITANQELTIEGTMGANGTIDVVRAGSYSLLGTAETFNAAVADANDIATLDRLINEATVRLSGRTLGNALANTAVAIEALIDTATEIANIKADIVAMQDIRAALLTNTAADAVAKKSDTTTGKNRMRVKFAAAGETDGGLAFGGSFRAADSAAAGSGTKGTQYISGAFGKISMGDLDGADEQLVGNLAGVGFSGAGSHEEFGYQSIAHNLAYKISMSGVSFAASTDLVRGADSAKTGSNSAMGISWSGDMGGTTVSVGLGQSKIGTKSENSASVSVAMGGLTIKAISHTNDNGPTVAGVAETALSTVGNGTAARSVYYKAATADTLAPDTDTTGLSISYSMDALSVTAFTRSEDDNTAGTADKDWSGVGFAYDLGGASLKAGFVDANDISVMDFGLTFSF